MRDQIVKKNKCGTIGRVEEHFLRHMQGSGGRGSHRRSPESLFRGSARGCDFPSGALRKLEDLLLAHLMVWSVSEKDFAGKSLAVRVF